MSTAAKGKSKQDTEAPRNPVDRISISQTRIVGVMMGEIASSLLVIAAWMGLLS